MSERRPSWEEEPERYWRDGDLLVCEPDADLPARCVACNEPSGGRRAPWSTRSRSKEHAAAERVLDSAIVKLLGLGGSVFESGFAARLLGADDGRTVRVYCGLCSDHARPRHLGTALVVMAWLLPAAGAIWALGALVGLSPPLSPAGYGLFAGLLLLIPGVALRRAPMPSCESASPSRVSLRVDPRFLATIPERETR